MFDIDSWCRDFAVYQTGHPERRIALHPPVGIPDNLLEFWEGYDVVYVGCECTNRTKLYLKRFINNGYGRYAIYETVYKHEQVTKCDHLETLKYYHCGKAMGMLRELPPVG